MAVLYLMNNTQHRKTLVSICCLSKTRFFGRAPDMELPPPSVPGEQLVPRRGLCGREPGCLIPGKCFINCIIALLIPIIHWLDCYSSVLVVSCVGRLTTFPQALKVWVAFQAAGTDLGRQQSVRYLSSPRVGRQAQAGPQVLVSHRVLPGQAAPFQAAQESSSVSAAGRQQVLTQRSRHHLLRDS